MGMTWNVTDENGSAIVDLDGIADALGMDRKGAAAYLAGASFLDAAPETLRAEVKAAAVDLAVGQFVTIDGKTGRIDLIVKDGDVPGVDTEVKGEPGAHAARVVLWDTEGDEPHATGVKVAAPVGDLEPTDAPLAQVVDVVDPDITALIASAAAGVDTARVPDEVAVKSAYERGVKSWPGAEVTTLTAHGWGLGRAEFFVKTAVGDTPAGNDLDLLPADHPLRRVEFATDAAVIAEVVDTPAADTDADAPAEDAETTTVSADDVKSLLASLEL